MNEAFNYSDNHNRSSQISGLGYGKEQSPIDITEDVVDKNLPDLQINYKDSLYRAVNDGHTIRIDYDKGSFLVFGKERYELRQFHFHSPAEHRINGQVFPMCAHLVHENEAGKLAVIGVKMTEGQENPFLAKFWEQLPAGEWDVQGNFKINAAEILPASHHYYTYRGSLTTPPYSEGVTWFVMKSSVTVSKAQIQKFVAFVGEHSRPCQPLNGRIVKEH
jgi:carbonic anhydrase